MVAASQARDVQLVLTRLNEFLCLQREPRVGGLNVPLLFPAGGVCDGSVDVREDAAKSDGAACTFQQSGFIGSLIGFFVSGYPTVSGDELQVNARR